MENTATERATRMVYRAGGDVMCGPYALTTRTIDDNEQAIASAKADGWYLTPQEADDADKAEQEARKEAALQAQIDANQKAIDDAKAAGTDTKKTTKRVPKSDSDTE